MSKLSLDRDRVDQCRKLAEQIISPVSHFIDRHTTVSIERCVLRLLGVEGSAEEKPTGKAPQGRYPLVNSLLSKMGDEALSKGAGYWLGLAALHHPGLDANELARRIVSDKIKLPELERAPLGKIDQAAQGLLKKQLKKLRDAREHKDRRPHWSNFRQPLRYIIVATGNIYEDIAQAQAAAEMGADIIAVIRSTAQSLLDHVPEGETIEGFGGTFATQENFRLMREALDETEQKLKRRIGLTNYSSGLCMPEIAVIGALQGVDYLLNDAMYGILFRDINMKRNFIDQYFSRRICALSRITIQTGEDNYLTTAESHKYWHQVLASHFINQAFAKGAGISDAHLALGHAFELDPWMEDSILFEIGQAQLVREIFPRNPIKFMPPTKHKEGDIFFSYLYDGMFNLVGTLTGQSIQLLGMHTEAIHNPFIQDRYLSLKNAKYVFNATKSAQDEITFQQNGKIVRRARQVLDDAFHLLKKVKLRGLFRAIEQGAFANVRRGQNAGKGAEGVILKARDYYTPLHRYLTPRALREAEGRGPRRGAPRGRREAPAPRRRSAATPRPRRPAPSGTERGEPSRRAPRTRDRRAGRAEGKAPGRRGPAPSGARRSPAPAGTGRGRASTPPSRAERKPSRAPARGREDKKRTPPPQEVAPKKTPDISAPEEVKVPPVEKESSQVIYLPPPGEEMAPPPGIERFPAPSETAPEPAKAKPEKKAPKRLPRRPLKVTPNNSEQPVALEEEKKEAPVKKRLPRRPLKLNSKAPEESAKESKPKESPKEPEPSPEGGTS